MTEVRPAVGLLDGYGDVIDACRTLAQVGDRYWNSIYLPLISSVADYFQLLTDRYGEHKLIEIALDGAHKSLELCVAADIKNSPETDYVCGIFSVPVPGCWPAGRRSRSHRHNRRR